MSRTWTRTTRAAIVAIGISAALGAGVAPGAFANPAACTAPAPTTTASTPDPDPVHRGGDPDPIHNGLDPDPVHKGVAVAPECDPSGAPRPAGTTGATADPASGAPATTTAQAGAPAGRAPAGPSTAGPSTADPSGAGPTPAGGSPAATPAGPAVHKGVVFPPSTEAPKPGAGPTASLTTLANAVVIRSRSVSTVVTVPAGLNVANPTEISILFGFGRRQTQDYDPAAGNRFTFDFDPGDATARTEDVAVSLTERAAGGPVPFGFVRKVPVEALYDVTISPLRFTLVNDCDVDFAGIFPQDSEPLVEWKDDRGDRMVELSMRGGQTRTIDGFARSLAGVTAKDGYLLPHARFEELDVPIPVPPFDFTATASLDPGPLLPGTTHTETHSGHSPDDEFCNGTWTFDSTITLRTYTAL